ncbi:MAG TPA: LuxR C-terminal-related transcriptional regulator [Thermomicrobiales bacterium]|nr:LuxR C-terminal-related transcriptional regulator [Thermomicrobiales bacterium]
MPLRPVLPRVPRGVEGLRLVAAGKTDREITEALFVSFVNRRTATTHLTSILTKLEVDNRTFATAFAVRSGLA